MRPIKQFNRYRLLLLMGVICVVASCKKDNEALESPRLFKPGGLSVRTSDTVARITWAPPLLSSGLQLTYTAEFSQDTAFATTEFALTTDTTGVSVTDSLLQVRKKYFVRVKANAYGDQPESKWEQSAGFTITGEQLFLPIRDTEVKETSVTLRWKVNPDLTRIMLIPEEGMPLEYIISSSEAAVGVKTISDLTAEVRYIAELFTDTRSMGILSFTTLPPTVYSVVLNPGDDLAAAITAAADNAVIGLNPGTYNTEAAGFSFVRKTLTIKSTSGDPSDTKVIFREFTLAGTGAGLILSGIECDGTPANAGYFINLTGVASNSEIAAFSGVNIDNCIIHGATTSLFRADRGSNAGDYSMDKIVINNCVVYDISTALSYVCFHLNKLQFNSMTVTKSTFYNIGKSLLSCSTVLPSIPSVTFDYCTFNNFGGGNAYVLMDAGSNPVRFNITNSIIANVPLPSQTVQNAVVRSTGAGSYMTFSNNNTFNFTNAAGVSLTFPTSNITQVGNLTEELGWVSTTTDFTLPAGSVLRTVSSSGTAIGDPRWTY